MKSLYLNIMFLFMCLSIYSQTTYTLKYVYDNAGNRTQRYLYSSGVKDADEIKESDNKETPYFADVIKIYPNPTTGELTIDFLLAEEKQIDVTVFDQNGRVLFEQDISGCTDQIDLTPYPSGTYLMKIAIDGHSKIYQVSKK
jgi:hypothetical protein